MMNMSLLSGMQSVVDWPSTLSESFSAVRVSCEVSFKYIVGLDVYLKQHYGFGLILSSGINSTKFDTKASNWVQLGKKSGMGVQKAFIFILGLWDMSSFFLSAFLTCVRIVNRAKLCSMFSYVLSMFSLWLHMIPYDCLWFYMVVYVFLYDCLWFQCAGCPRGMWGLVIFHERCTAGLCS